VPLHRRQIDAQLLRDLEQILTRVLLGAALLQEPRQRILAERQIPERGAATATDADPYDR
jgi:hypothetical protein